MSSGTDTKSPTVASTYITMIKMWNVDITAKYIPASLMTVLRIFEKFIPWCLDAMCFVSTRTNAKTKRSRETDKWFNSRNGEIRKSDEMLTEGDVEGKLKDDEGPASFT